MAMAVTYVDRQKKRIFLSPGLTCYILPDSGIITIQEIASSYIYINGESCEVMNGFHDIDVRDFPLEIEVDNCTFNICVLCRQYRDEAKFDYNMLRIAFTNNLDQERMNEDILFKAIGEEVDSFRLPLCTFNRKFESVTRDYDIAELSECANHLMHIFQKPKQHLKQINEIRPATMVSQIGQESIRHLASHSEY